MFLDLEDRGQRRSMEEKSEERKLSVANFNCREEKETGFVRDDDRVQKARVGVSASGREI